MKSVLAITGILLASLPLISAELQYKLSVGYVYDSNIGQNTNEVGKSYFVPEGYLKLKGEKVPLFLKVASTYENYLTERSPVLNSPFLTVSGGGEFGKKKLTYNTELRASLYYGQSAQDRIDGGTEPTSWAPAKNSYRWYNDFELKLKRQRIKLGTQMQLNDYGVDGKDGFRLILEPEYQYRFKVKKKDKVKLRYLSLMPEFEGNYVKSDVYSYNYFAIGAGAGFKLWRSTLFTSVTYASKDFIGWVEHPHTSDLIDVKNRYVYTYGSWSMPIVADLSVKVKGKLRFKDSTNPSYDWNRHTIGIDLVWASTMGKYLRKDRSYSEIRDNVDREEL